MKKLTSPRFLQTGIAITGVLILAGVIFAADGQAGSDPRPEGFSNDPTLSEAPVAPGTPDTSLLTVESKGDQTNVSVGTHTSITPYLGAVKKPADAPEDMLYSRDNRSDNLLDNYHLETGVGLRVNQRTRINLGYRFNNPPALLDNQSNEATRQDDGDLRFSLEIKLPF